MEKQAEPQAGAAAERWGLLPATADAMPRVHRSIPKRARPLLKTQARATEVESDRPSMRNDRPDRRTKERPPDEITPVRLTRKYAEALNGVDLSGHDVGDRLPLPPRDARLLIADGWAAPAPAGERRQSDLVRSAARSSFTNDRGTVGNG